MSSLAQTLITLGCLLLVGFLADGIGKRTKLPRVTLLLILGFLIGPSAFAFLPDLDQEWFVIVTHMALVMIGFLLGGQLTLALLRKHGRLVLWISLSVVIVTALVELVGLAAIGLPTTVALILAGVAPATAPAATLDVVHEANADGPFVRTLLGIVAIDDAWGLMLFSLVLAGVGVANGDGALEALSQGSREVFGAVALGTILGIPMSYLTGRVRPGEPTLVEALGVVFLCGGLAVWLDVSLLLAAMTMGLVVANLAKHHERPFHAIENIEWPFMILFFVFAGASLHIESLAHVGLVGGAYIVLRIGSRLLGAWLGAKLSGAEPSIERWMGMALMPQAGVALGMALVATQRYPKLAEAILPVVILSTVLFEIIGPVCTRWAIVKAGELSDEPN